MIVNAYKGFHIARECQKDRKAVCLPSKRDLSKSSNRRSVPATLELGRVEYKVGLGLGDEKVQKKSSNFQAIYQPCL
jgi:hypothetical protein